MYVKMSTNPGYLLARKHKTEKCFSRKLSFIFSTWNLPESLSEKNIILEILLYISIFISIYLGNNTFDNTLLNGQTYFCTFNGNN